MNIIDLNQNLKELAIQHGLCQQWQDEWDNESSIDMLIKKFYDGIDFYLSTRFVSKEQIVSFFSENELLSHHVIVDKQYSLLNPIQAIAIGDSQVKVRCNNYKVCNVYACDNAVLNVSVKGNALLAITLCDNASIKSIGVEDSASVYVCLAGEGAQCCDTGNLKVKIHKNYNLYK